MLEPNETARLLSDLLKKVDEKKPEKETIAQVNSFFCLEKAVFVKPKKVAAFTLAEVLVTLGIIGVVAAMTLPHLVEGYQKIVLQTQLKKFVNSFTRAYNQAVAQHGDSEWWDNCKVKGSLSSCSLSLQHEYILENFQGIDCSKNIIPEKYKKEFADARYIYNDSTVADSFWTSKSMTHCRLNDGGYLLDVSSSKDTYLLEQPVYTSFIVDINGSNRPNRHGKDIFGFIFFYKLKANSKRTVGVQYGVSAEIFRPVEKMLLIDGWGSSHPRNYNKVLCGRKIPADRRGYSRWLRPCQEALQQNGWEFPKNYPW